MSNEGDFGPAPQPWASPSGASAPQPWISPSYGPPPQAPDGSPLPPWVRPEPPALKPGVIPLRPLDLSSLYNGAVAAIRQNPKAAFLAPAVIVIVAQLVSYLVAYGGITALVTSLRETSEHSDSTPEPMAALFNGGYMGAVWLSSIVGMISGAVITGILTVTVGRAVFGEHTTAGEAWQRTKPRVWALVGLGLCEVLLFGVPSAIGIAIVVASFVMFRLIGFLVLFVVAMAWLALYAYLITVFALAAPALILERRRVFGAISRASRLARKGFWRVLGILVLTIVVTGVVSGVLVGPAQLVSQSFLANAIASSDSSQLLLFIGIITAATTLATIVTAPFTASVNVLLYTDQRMRAEAFDLVLHTEAITRQGSAAPARDADSLWLS